MKRTLLVIATVSLAAGGCGSSKKATTTNPAAGTGTGSATTTGSAATAAGSATTTGSTSTAGVAVTEKEFSITLASPLVAGQNTLDVSNTGSFAHELKIVKADNFAALPIAADGSVNETALGAAVIAVLPKIANGASGTLSVSLPAGNYVLICNLGTGANNHAAKGMHTDITVG